MIYPTAAGVGTAFSASRITAVLEILIQLAESRNLSGANEGEVLGPEEIHFPLARIVLIGNWFECIFHVGADGGRQREKGTAVLLRALLFVSCKQKMN